MNYKVIFSSRATEELNDLLLYIAETNSPTVAINYIDKIEQVIEKLKNFPNMGKIPLQRYLQLQNFRVLTIESHLVYYKVIERDKTIRIYTIKHARQNQKNI